ncbi:aldose epimerase [Nakamurella silvestris]|nr:aldose epimerase [Nakamurella silvestris]
MTEAVFTAPTDWLPQTQPHPASGEQHVLTFGSATVRVGSVAAVLREYSIGDVHFTETWTDEVVAPFGCGIVLTPWPNRVVKGRWDNNGTVEQLDITEPARNAALHGLMRNTVYTAMATTENSVTLSAPIYPQHGYPFTLDTSVTYRLTAEGLTVTHRLVNIGTGRAPFGLGTHPFLKISSFPTADLRLTSNARTYIAVDELLSPVSADPVDGTPSDLRHGPRVGDLDLDTAYTGLDLIDGEHRAVLTAPDGSSVQMWAEPIFGWQQIFTTDSFPGSGVAVAVEPMTCGIDAFNNGNGLLHLEPGQAFEGSWGIRPVGFPV